MAKPAIRLVLAYAASPGSKGSMRRYAELVKRALEDLPQFGSHFEIRTLNLSILDTERGYLPRGLRTWVNHVWLLLTGPLRLRRQNPDLLHLLDGSYGYLLCGLGGIPAIATVHDLIPFLQLQGRFGPDRPSVPASWIVKRSLKGLRRSAALIAVSTRTRRDLQQEAQIQGNYLCVIPNALDPKYQNALHDRDTRSKAEQEQNVPLIMHVGHNGRYKNRDGVLRVFAMVRKSAGCGLLLAGAAPSASLLKLVQEMELQNDVEFAVDIDDSVLREIYQRASLLLFPSLYEGFGWPPLEAMACGCPVVCSSEGSLAEVVGDAALTAPAKDEDQLARHCLRVLQDPELASSMTERGRQRASQFTVKCMGEQLLAVYRRVLAQAGHPEPPVSYRTDA